MDDSSDSDDSILLTARSGLRSRPKRQNKKDASSSFSMKHILKESEKMVAAKSSSVKKIYRANQNCQTGETDDMAMQRIQAHADEMSAAKKEEAKVELPPGFDGSCSLEDYKLMLENIELEGTYLDGKLEIPFQFVPVDGLFFQTKKEAVNALEDLLHVETELNNRLRAVIARDLLIHFLDSSRFREMLGTAPTDSTVCVWEWLLKVACSAGLQGMQQLGRAAQQVLLQSTSTFGIEGSTVLLQYLSSWVPSPGPASSASENSSSSSKEESPKPMANLAGLKNVVALAAKTVAVVEFEDTQPCILCLIRFALCDLCSVSALMERIVALAQLKRTNRDWIQPMCSNIFTEINRWGEKGSSGAWMSLVAAAKLFCFSNFDSEHHKFAVASAVEVAEMCLSVDQLDDSDIVDPKQTAKQTFATLSQEVPDNPLIATVHAAATGWRHFEQLAVDEPRCQAMVACIVRLFHLGYFGERSEKDTGLVTAKNAAIVFDYTSLLIPILEKISSEVSKRNNVAAFQRSDMSLRLLLRYVNMLQEKAESKRVSPKSQATLSKFFAPKATAASASSKA